MLLEDSYNLMGQGYSRTIMTLPKKKEICAEAKHAKFDQK